MNKRSLHLLSVVSLLLSMLNPFIAVQARPLHQPICTVGGTVFRDYDADGLRSSPQETGVEGIIVNAYDAAGAVIDSAVTDAEGVYALTQLPPAEEVRIEFEMPAPVDAFLNFGPDGSGTNTSVVFVTCADAPAGGVNLGLANPGQHCEFRPDVVTSCFVLGDSQTGDNSDSDTLISFPFDAGSPDLTSPIDGRFDLPAHGNLADANEIGAVWGLAYRRTTGFLYGAAFLKRHADFGPGGPGAIYQIDYDGSSAPSVLTTLTASGGQLHTDGTDYPGWPAGTEPWLIDLEAYDEIGKAGLGELTISDDDNTLWVVNLFDRRLYSIPIDNPGAATSFAIPTNPPGCASADVRPFGAQHHDGIIYVGLTCTAESTQIASQLRAYVYQFDLASLSFGGSPVLDIPLTYPRGCITAPNDPFCQDFSSANWNPWSGVFPPDAPANGGNVSFPQPWLSDIEFDSDGNMILGIRDRLGDQLGAGGFSTIPGDTNVYAGVTGGDILRACITGPNSWTLESNASCGGDTTGGAGNGEGPGGGEFYFEDELADFHAEVSMGSLLQLPGEDTLLGTFFDPIPLPAFNDGGLRWLDNSDGTITRAYRVFNGDFPDVEVFGKANGLGGMEAICPPAPIEIGNRVWYDVDQNGQQDPGETPVGGVTVRLYDSAGNLISETTTNGAGEYLFTSASNNVEFNTDYEIRLDDPANYVSGGPLFEWFLTFDNTVTDWADSDGIMTNGFPVIVLNTGGPGANNHTYDFGFFQDEPTPTPTPTNTPTETPTPGDTPTPNLTETPGDNSTGTPFIETPTRDPSSCLVIDKEVDPPFAQIGDVVTWTIVVTNRCSTTREDVVVTDDVPDGLEIISVDSSAGTVDISGQNITVDIGSLAPGASVRITIVTRISDRANVPVLFDNFAFVDGTWDTARVVRASQLVETGETPWWQGPLLALGILMMIVGGMVSLLRQKRGL